MTSVSRSLALSLVAAALFIPGASGSAHAADPLYLGQKHHVRLDLGASFFFLEDDDEVDIWGLSPIVSGRFALSEKFGLSVVVPTAFASFSSSDSGESESRFKLGNPTLAFELVDDAQEYKRAVLRFGVGIPVASLSTDNLGDFFFDAFTYSAAALGRGNVDFWLWAPDALSLFAEFHTTAFLVDLFVDLRFSLAGLIGTGDSEGFELLLQSVMRFGYDAGTVIPFGGLTLVWIPTADGDAFQSGLQLGAIFNLGGPSIDAALQINLDDPGGFSFDDGVLGVQVGVTVPF